MKEVLNSSNGRYLATEVGGARANQSIFPLAQERGPIIKSLRQASLRKKGFEPIQDQPQIQ